MGMGGTTLEATVENIMPKVMVVKRETGQWRRTVVVVVENGESLGKGFAVGGVEQGGDVCNGVLREGRQ